MSRKGVIEQEKPQQCDECGEIKELRPYGKNGAVICWECFQRPDNEHTVTEAEKHAAKHLFGEEG